jgi:hypothetical protein
MAIFIETYGLEIIKFYIVSKEKIHNVNINIFTSKDSPSTAISLTDLSGIAGEITFDPRSIVVSSTTVDSFADALID